MTIRTALRTSSNRAAVRMLQDIGIPKAVDYAKRLGVGDVPSVPSLALGSGEVTLMSMTSAYASFAAQGIVRPAVMIRRIEDDHGKLIYETHSEGHQAISPATAFLMSAMLSDVVNYGTAYKARQEGFTLPAAGKTGTTNDFHDAWFVGFTPRLVAGVWVGFDKPRTILPNGFAGDLAVPMWAHFMKAVTAQDKPEWLPAPPNIVAVNVCRSNGMLADDLCDRVITEYFVRGSEPKHTAPPEIPALASFGTGIGAAPAVGPHAPPPPVIAEQASAEHERADVPPSGSDVEKKEPKKKHGFWGRLFGKHDKDESKRDDADTK
jgi:membrane carboxypeptidase/penicillin-binding protein